MSLNEKSKTAAPEEGVLDIAYMHFSSVALTSVGLCALVDAVVNRGDTVSIATAGALTTAFAVSTIFGFRKSVQAADQAKIASENANSKPPAP